MALRQATYAETQGYVDFHETQILAVTRGLERISCGVDEEGPYCLFTVKEQPDDYRSRSAEDVAEGMEWPQSAPEIKARVKICRLPFTSL